MRHLLKTAGLIGALLLASCAGGPHGTPGIGLVPELQHLRLHVDSADERSVRASALAQMAAQQQGMEVVASASAADLTVQVGWTGNLGWDRVSYDSYRLVTRRNGQVVADDQIQCAVELAPDCQGSFVRYLKRVVDGTAPGPVVAMTGGEREVPNGAPSSAPTPSARIRRGATVANSFALIVGIEHYRDLPASTGALHDAESFAALARESLGVPAENVRRLNDEHATRADLESELHWLQLNAQNADRVYFYFGGHGAPDPTTGNAFLLPYDTNPTDPAAAGLALDSALQALAVIGSQNVIAFVDSCFSGAGGRSVLPAGARPLAIVKAQVVPPQVALFSAAGPNQISGMNAQGNGGLFTEYVFDGLGLGRADANGDGNVSLGELATWVTPEVRKAALRANRDQTPLLQFANTGFDPAALILLRGTQAK